MLGDSSPAIGRRRFVSQFCLNEQVILCVGQLVRATEIEPPVCVSYGVNGNSKLVRESHPPHRGTRLDVLREISRSVQLAS